MTTRTARTHMLEDVPTSGPIMVIPSRHRRLLLLLCLLLLPCTAVVVLGVRTLIQERELARSRIEDDRLAVGRELGQAFEAHLATLRARVGAGAPPGEDGPSGALVLASPIVDGALRMPWDGPAQRERAERFRAVLDDPGIRRGEALELARRDPDAAAEAYREIVRPDAGSAAAVAGEPDSLLEAYARLLLSRSLRTSGDPGEAREHERALLEQPATVADEHGIPLALYAASRWSADGRGLEVRRVLGDMLRSPGWMSPGALYLLRDLRDASPREPGDSGVGGVSLDRTLERRIAAVEHVLAIARDLPALEARWGAEGAWVVHGSEPWLAGRVDAVGPSPPLLLVVDPRRILEDLTRTGRVPDVDDLALTASAGPSTVPLTPTVPGLFARFTAPDDPLNARRLRWQIAFLGSSVLAVVGLALLGAWLLLRDVQREMRLASLRSAFVSSVSHELRTPLAAIRMFAEIMQERSRDRGDPEGEYVETIAGESERLTRLLDNVLDFARIERGQKRYRPTPTALADIARHAERTLRYLLEKERFELHLDLDEGLPLVSVDRDAVEQAILNLLTNAMKYSGGERSIGLRVGRRNGHAVIEVTDRGVGIHPDDQARIFEEFYRAPGPDPDAVPGTGLGLTVVRHVAEGHGGFVTVRSAPSEGSTFAIHIPLDGEDHGSEN